MRKRHAHRLMTINFSLLFILVSFNQAQSCPLSVVTPTYSFPSAVCAGETVTVTWTSDCATPLMQISLISQPPLAFAVVQNVSSLPNTGTYSFVTSPTLLPGTYNFFIADNGVTAWNYGAMFTIKPPPGLPVELSDFSAEQIDDSSIELLWSTESENDNYGFEVEHSTDGESWMKIHFAPGKQNSTVETKYTFNHERPTFGSNFYRLKQIDRSGEATYSETVQVEFELKSHADLKIYPNPSASLIHIPLKFLGKTQWSIYSVTGLKVGSGILTKEGIDIAYLLSGKYHLVVTNSGNQINSTFLKL